MLRFDGADWIRFSTLATALGNTSDGAWTVAVLLRQATDSGFQGYTYLCGAGPDTKAGIGRQSGGLLICDIDSYGSTGQDVVGTTETYIAVAAKAAGTSPVTYHLFTKSAGTWATPIVGGNLTDTAASTMLEIGTWQGGSDMADAWIGLVGFWEGAMSTGNVTQLDDGWQSSDWWASAHGAPTALIECNVAAASLIDVAGNATNVSVTGTPTLDGAETLVSWNFNGDGSGVPPEGSPTVMTDFTRSLFPFMARSAYKLGSDRGGISSPTRERGPAAYGGFQRFLARRLHPVYATVTEHALAANLLLDIALDGAVLRETFLAGDVAADLTLDGAITRTTSLTGDITLPLTLDGAILRTTSLIGDIALDLTLDGTLTRVHPLAGDITLDIVLDGAVTRTTFLTGDIDGTITLDGNIAIGAAAQALAAVLTLPIALDGAITRTTSLVGDIALPITLDGAVTRTTFVVGDITLPIVLDGAVTRTTFLIGDIAIPISLDGDIQVQGAVFLSGDMSLDISLDGIVKRTTFLVGDVALPVELDAAIGRTTTLAGDIVLPLTLDGNIGTLAAIIPATLTITEAGTVTVTLTNVATPTVSVLDATGPTVAVTDTNGAQATVQDQTGTTVTILDTVA